MEKVTTKIKIMQKNLFDCARWSKSFGMRCLFILLATGLYAPFAYGQFTFASDNAGNYGGSWNSSQGTGFTVWSYVNDGGSGGSAGRFLGNPSSGAELTGMSDPSFALFANPNVNGNLSKAGRDFADGALQIGDVFSFQMGLNWDAGNGNGFKGIDLKNASGTTILNFNMGGTPTITWSRPGAGSGGELFTDYGTQAMNFTITRVGTNQYRVVATPRAGSTNYNQVITLAGEIAGFDFYAGRQDPGGNREPYYNNLSITNSGNFNFSGTHTYSRVLTGSSNVSKTGTGTLVLTGANTYTGSTTVSGGVMELNRSGGATLASTNNVTVNVGTLRIRSNQTLNNLTVTGGTLIVDAGVTLTINGSFTGGGTIQNNGTIVLVGPSAFPGATTTVSAMNNLTINRASGVSLNQNLTVTGNLTLTSGLLSLGASNLLVNGSVIGGSSSAYINTDGAGTFRPRVAATGSNTFHVGSAGIYAPVVLNFTAASFGGDPRLVMGTGAGTPAELHSSNTNYVGRTWVIEPQDITAFTYDIEFTYASSEITMGTTESNLIPVKFSGGTWYRPVGTGASLANEVEQGTFSINTTTNTVSWSGLTTFSEFLTVENTSNPLPVELISFNGNCNADEVVLTWATASEFNASHFNVEMSRDGFVWNPIGRVEAAGTTSQATNYQFSTAQAGAITYFRLVQVDFDGASEIFGPISTKCDVKVNDASVFPNPVEHELNLSLNSKTAYKQTTISILDMSGRVVQTLTLNIEEGTSIIPIAVDHLENGSYLIRFDELSDQFPALRFSK